VDCPPLAASPQRSPLLLLTRCLHAAPSPSERSARLFLYRLTRGCTPLCRVSRMGACWRLSSRAAAPHHTLCGCGTAALYQRCACRFCSSSRPRSFIRTYARPASAAHTACARADPHVCAFTPLARYSSRSSPAMLHSYSCQRLCVRVAHCPEAVVLPLRPVPAPVALRRLSCYTSS
jgi:hypothetical protein